MLRPVLVVAECSAMHGLQFFFGGEAELAQAAVLARVEDTGVGGRVLLEGEAAALAGLAVQQAGAEDCRGVAEGVARVGARLDVRHPERLHLMRGGGEGGLGRGGGGGEGGRMKGVWVATESSGLRSEMKLKLKLHVATVTWTLESVAPWWK
jgi:hypothetical protein